MSDFELICKLLEDGAHPETKEWVKRENEETFNCFSNHPEFQSVLSRCREQIKRSRIESLAFNLAEDGKFYRVYTSTGEDAGKLERTDSTGLIRNAWDEVLDLVELRKEGWILCSYTCEAISDRALFSFSREGSDSRDVREYDLSKKRFVDDGFRLPVGENQVAWINRDEIIYASSLTKEFSYPNEINIWNRSTKISTRIFSSHSKVLRMVNYPHSVKGPSELDSLPLILHVTNFSLGRDDIYCIPDLKNPTKQTRLDLPSYVDVKGIIDNWIVVLLHENWMSHLGYFRSNTIILVNLDVTVIERVFTPLFGYIKEVLVLRDKILLTERYGNRFCLWEIKPSRKVVMYSNGKLSLNVWSISERRLDYPNEGTVSVVGNSNCNTYLVNYSDYLCPTEIYLHKEDASRELVKKSPTLFDHSLFEKRQFRATSFDGTQIPYTAVMSKNFVYNGENRCLLTAYGGFNISLDPHYVGYIGTELLTQGFVYVVAHIRGGGEFGTNWHRAAVLQYKTISYLDFFSVMSDLHQRKITSPKHLSIKGTSNGGLLVGVAVTQASHLFSSAISEHGLHDMLRFPISGKGKIWINEYGNPSDPNMKEVLETYSPLHNIDGTPQARFLLTSSSNDDRVDPSHSRKMALMCKSAGHQTFLYEREGGGHSGFLDIDAEARITAIRLIFLRG